MKWMMTCEEVAASASDVIDGASSWRVRIGVRLHTLMCGACREYLRQMRLVIEALRRSPRAAPSPGNLRRLLEIFRTSSRP